MRVLAIIAWACVSYAGGRLLQKWLQIRRTWRVLARLPHPTTSETYLGSLEVTQDGMDHVFENMTALADQLGGVYALRILHKCMASSWGLQVIYRGPLCQVVVTDPAIGQVLLSAKLNLPKDPELYGIFNSLTSPNGRQPNMLGHTTNNGYWRLVRKGVMPAFSPNNIRREFPHVLALSEQLCTILAAAGAEGRLIDVDNLLQRESMDVIGRVGFNADLGALRQAAASLASGAAAASLAGMPGEGTLVLNVDGMFSLVKAAATEVARRWNEPLRYPLRHLIPSARRAEADLAALQACMRQLLRLVQARGPPPADDTSIAAQLLRIKDPVTGLPLSDEQLAGEIALFFVAGFETTGHTMAWCLFLLASHPEAAARVEAELDTAGLLVTPGRPHPRRLQYDDLSKLKQLGNCIKESMRLIPVVSGGQARVPQQDIMVQGCIFPAGVTIIIGGHGLMNSKHNWERPSDFLPERWEEPGAEYSRGDLCPVHSGPTPTAGSSRAGPAPAATATATASTSTDEEEEEEAGEGEESWHLVDRTRPPLRFAPFQQGPRSCAGQSLAQMNITATLAVLLSRFRFELPEHLRGPDALRSLRANRMTTQPRDGLPMLCVPRGRD